MNKSINTLEKNKCNGCSACEAICPTEAITMKYEKDGFLYPNVNYDKCTNCGLCSNICPELNFNNKNYSNPVCYAVQSNDDSSKDWTDTVPAAVAVSSSVSHNSTNTGGVSSKVSSGGSTQPYVSVEAVPNYVVEKIDMSNVPDAPEDTICAANTNLNVKSKKKGITSTFSKQTQEIVTKHANDFKYDNFKSIIGGDEDFKNYCKKTSFVF